MIVMKFGGTSVADATAISALASAVADARADDPLVVVSAMSGVTDTLVAITAAMLHGDHLAVAAAREALRDRHQEVASDLGVTEQVHADLEAHLERLGTLVTDRRELTAAGRDAILGTGELLSSCLVAAALADRGMPARWCDARRVIRTDARFGAAIPDQAAIRRLAAQEMRPHIDAGALIVTQGFIGATATGESTVLGRGGSDFTAALLGAALDAERVEIWTDVSGLMTADPRIVPDAHVLAEATYDEAAELAAFGAKVLHPATQLPLVEAGIPIVIRNTFAREAPGTRIAAEAATTSPQSVRSISIKRGVTVLQVRAARMLGAFGFLRRIFEVFERHEIVVDVLATSEVSVSLTVDPSPRLEQVVRDLAELGEVTQREHRAVIAVVGGAIRDTPGIAARVYQAIADVNVEMTSQGASTSNLTFIVREEEGPRVVRALHATFFGGPT
ncbi:MAG: lysine-sensitive aspartokinase 3 [Gemmatimonadales bacterium]|nr:lysine-sensitive aspartokinase 3 [Gemmatimonadales bacterium]